MDDAYPVGLFQTLLSQSGAVTQQGRVDWKKLRRFFREQFQVVFDFRLARHIEQELRATGRSFPRSEPDVYLSHDGGDVYRIVPADPEHLRPADPCSQYRRFRGFFHEFVHILDLIHPNRLSPHAVFDSHMNSGFSVDRDRLPSQAKGFMTDPATGLKELMTEDMALFFFAPPAQFGERIKQQGTTNIDLAQHFRISIDDVDRYLSILLMCTTGSLEELGLTVHDLQEFLARPHYDPVEFLARSIAEEKPLPTVDKRLIDAPIYDLDFEAEECMGMLLGLVRGHIALHSSRPACPSPFPDLIDNFLRRHSGSELRFLIRRGSPAPVLSALAVLRNLDSQSHAAAAALACCKLGYPELGVKVLRRHGHFEKEPRLLEVLGFCMLELDECADRQQAVKLYQQALRLDPENPEIRFGFAKSLLKLEGFSSAEAALKRMGKPSHWLESYLLGKIEFLRYTRGGGMGCLNRAEEHLLKALDAGVFWPPRIIQFLERDPLSSEEPGMLASGVLDIDGDRKKAINLLAKIYKIKSKKEARPDLQSLCKALLLLSWTAHKLDSKTNFCLFEFHLWQNDRSDALLRLRELLHLRPSDLRVWLYLKSLIIQKFPEWTYYAQGIDRLVERRSKISGEVKA